MLTYEFLKQNVTKVELLKDINMGDVEDFLDSVDNQIITGFMISEDRDAIIQAGTIGEFNVQPFNSWYEMTIDGKSFDVALDDNELNDFIKLIEVVGPNKHFVKEEA